MNSTLLMPSKEEQRIAKESYSSLADELRKSTSDDLEIEVTETNELIRIPKKALELLEDILKAMSEGIPISLIPVDTELSTQKAAELLGCSRPFLIKLLEKGEIPFTKIGRHRRIKAEDVLAYKKAQKEKQKQYLIKIMQQDEELGLYDS